APTGRSFPDCLPEARFRLARLSVPFSVSRRSVKGYLRMAAETRKRKFRLVRHFFDRSLILRYKFVTFR
ncbi:hypothetical protein, partial [Paracoccus sp. (in: a-proteobacteria)]|uniref:hypothetical protein n=1 Tax=Paracoccus sp. TaxID=267 RepID=UPI004058D72C